MRLSNANQMISDLEAEIKSLRKKLRDAEALLVEKTKEIQRLKNIIGQKTADKAVPDKSDLKKDVSYGNNGAVPKFAEQLEDSALTSSHNTKSGLNEIANHAVKAIGPDRLIQMWLEAGGTIGNPPSVSLFFFKHKENLKPLVEGKNFGKVAILQCLLNEVVPNLIPNELRKKLEADQEELRKKEEQRAQREELTRADERRKKEEKRRLEQGSEQEGRRRSDEYQRSCANELPSSQIKKFEKELREDWLLHERQLDKALTNHSIALMRNMRQSHHVNEYGSATKDERRAEILRFLSSMRLMSRAQKHGLERTIQHITLWYEKAIKESTNSEVVPESGHDFEHWVAAQLNKAFWKATVTQASSDDGVDVIAERGGISVAVQCKRFKGSVGNKAIQEVYSGMKHMGLERAVVISTGQYTKAAQNLAATTGVLLLSEHDIPHLWEFLGNHS